MRIVCGLKCSLLSPLAYSLGHCRRRTGSLRTSALRFECERVLGCGKNPPLPRPPRGGAPLVAFQGSFGERVRSGSTEVDRSRRCPAVYDAIDFENPLHSWGVLGKDSRCNAMAISRRWPARRLCGDGSRASERHHCTHSVAVRVGPFCRRHMLRQSWSGSRSRSRSTYACLRSNRSYAVWPVGQSNEMMNAIHRTLRC